MSLTLRILFLTLLTLPALAQEAQLTVELKGMRSFEGNILLLVFDQAEGFPGKPEVAIMEKTFPATRANQTFVLEGLPSGQVALSLVHDENANGELDTSFFGIPKEGWGVSRDAKPSGFGPPAYEDCAIELSTGSNRHALSFRY